MEINPTLGPALPEIGWVPSIRYLLRRARVLRLLRSWQGERAALEVGCGSGALLVELARSGFHCAGLESSPEAYARAKELAEHFGVDLALGEEPEEGFDRSFDLVCALDVLEHVEDDVGALATWARWLKPGGKLLLSVPAHRNRWGPGDVWAGHFRRYDRAHFREIIEGRGLRIEHFECYGFPAANLTEWIGKGSYRRLLASQSGSLDRAQATARSGIERSTYQRLYPLISSAPGRLGVRLCCAVQSLFGGTDWGSGYIALAVSR